MITLVTDNDTRPFLETERMLLRPFQMSDALDVRRLAGDIRVAEQLARMPHPYPAGVAEEWISGQRAEYEAGTNLNFAITLKVSSELMGSIGFVLKEDRLRSEIGYWLGVPYWGLSYMTEALEEMIRFGFEDFGLQRIFAVHLATNPASGRVMEKAGMKLEGFARLGVSQHGKLRDGIQRAIVKPDWEMARENDFDG